MECAREQRAERRNDPKKYTQDKAYTRKWVGKNIEHVKDQAKILRLKNTTEKRFLVNAFLTEHHGLIKETLKKLKSPLKWMDISKHCHRFGVTTFDAAFEFIKNNKFSQLKDQAAWKHSTLVKYHYGVRENYADISETFKEKIRAEYKISALKEATQKIEELCKTV